MKMILKYEVGRNGDVYTITGRIARLLDVQWIPTQGMMVWCEISDEVEEVSLDIAAIGTGWELPSDVMATMKYFGTAFDGMNEWHYYWTRHIEVPDNEAGEEEEDMREPVEEPVEVVS